jgi:hypothetical protein
MAVICFLSIYGTSKAGTIPSFSIIAGPVIILSFMESIIKPLRDAPQLYSISIIKTIIYVNEAKNILRSSIYKAFYHTYLSANKFNHLITRSNLHLYFL